MKLKTFLKAASVVAFASTLIACGNAGGNSSDKVEIEFFSQKGEMKATLDEIVADFEKANPEIDVKLTSVPDAGTVLKTRMANNEAPDVIHIYPQNADFKGWAADGRFLEIDDAAGLSNLEEGAADTYAVDGKIYSLPLNANAYAIFYNKNKFKELGLEAPTTLAEFENIIKVAKDKGEAPFALSLADNWSLNGYGQLAWATTAGGFDATQDILRFSDKGAIKADDTTKQVVEVLSLLTDNGQNGFAGAKYADTVAAFAAGDALMLPQGIWALPVIREQQPDFEVGTFALPGKEAGQELTVGAADLALSISKDSKHPEEAKKFLAYLSSAEAMQRYYDVDGQPTSVKGVDTEGKFPETEGVTQYAFTDKHLVWLHSEWDSEEEFWNIVIKQVKTPDAEIFAKDLNAFFDTMKK